MNSIFLRSGIKLRSLLLFILLSFGLLTPAIHSQSRIVTGTIESVPSMTHPKTKITLQDISYNDKFVAVTDENGAFNIKAWSGTYKRTVETLNNYLYIDTVTITPVSVNNYQLQTISDDTITSTYFSSFRDEIASMTGTGTLYGNYAIQYRWTNQGVPFCARRKSDFQWSMPDTSLNAPFNLSVDEFNTIDTSKLQLKEVFNTIDSTKNALYLWPPNNIMPPGANANTARIYSGVNIVGASILMDRDIINSGDISKINSRELWRAIGLETFSNDPNMISYINGSQSYHLHPDEKKVIKVFYCLKSGTNFFPHKFTVVKNIYWPPEKISSIPSTTIQEDSHNNIVAVLSNVFRNPNPNGTLLYTWTPLSNLNFSLHSDTLLVTPIAGYYGTDQVIITAADTSGQSIADTVTITTQKTNFAPSASRLLNPLNNDTLKSDTTTFSYTCSIDINNEPISYFIHIFGNGIDTTFSTTDTNFTKTNMIKVFGQSITYRWTINSYNGFYSTASPDTFKFTTSIITGIKEQRNEIPTAYTLNQNFPNPFNPSTTIKYSLPKASHVSLSIYNSKGQEVSKLISKDMNAGIYTTEWNASGFASGVYYCKMVAGDFVQTRKLLLLK